MGLISVVAIGMGGMIGAGIFALLGLAVSISGAGVWIAFIVGGTAALASSHSFGRLAVTYPSRGGAATFVNRAYQSTMLAGSLNVLLWLGYVVVLSLYARAFGAYAARLLGVSTSGLVAHVLMTAPIAAFTALNMVGGRAVGRAESVLVYAKVAVLAGFVVLGASHVHGDRLAATSIDVSGTALAAAVLFLAYEGFGLMANTSEEMRDPDRDLPRAFTIAVVGVIVVYAAVALVAVGVAPQGALMEAKDYALAVAGRAIGGSWGFNAIAVTAVVSTAGSLNATLYGAARVSYVLGIKGQLPEAFGHELWDQPAEGLVVTAGLVTVLTNVVDLSAISLMGSSAFLIVYTAVNIAAIRLRSDTRVTVWVSAIGAALCVTSLVGVGLYAGSREPAKLLVLAGMLIVAIATEGVLRKTRLGASRRQ